MTIGFLQNGLDTLRMQWRAWLSEAFPAAIPLPEPAEIPGRDTLLLQLEEKRKSHAQEAATRQEAIQVLLADLKEAQRRVDQLTQRLTEHHQAESLATALSGAELDRLQAQLSERAPITLGLFIDELDHELTCLRRMVPTIVPSGSDRNYSLMKKTMRYQTNASSIKRRVEALQRARVRAVSMQTENMTVKEILDEVYRLKKRLPAIIDEETRGPLAAIILAD